MLANLLSLKRILSLSFLTLVLSFPAQADDFILSYWCGPPPEPSADLDRRYAEVAECGFNYAMLPCGGLSAAGNQAILDACKKHKLKYIVYDSRLSKFAPTDPAFKTNLELVVSTYEKHPALGGYFMADEPAPGAFPLLAGINQFLQERDPKRLPFVNLYPNYAPEWAIGPYEKYIEDFLTIVKPRLLSFDHYALMTDGSLRPIYFDNLEIVRRQGLKHDVPIGFIFQLTPHFSYRNPTEEELRWQANTALIYGARSLMYFTYWTPTADPAFTNTVAIIDPKGNRSPHYERAKKLNREILAWAPTLMKLRSTGVYHTAPLPKGAAALPGDALVRIKEEGAFIIGNFRHDDGSEWAMVMNRDMKTPVTASLLLGEKVRRVRELSSKKGKLTSLKMRNHSIPVQLAAGEARLFKLSF